MDQEEYQLRSELQGHQEDVRAVCACLLGLWTASRDGTIKLWTEVDVGHFVPSVTLVGHTSFVGALAYVHTSAGHGKGRLISGSRDTTIILWDVETAVEIYKLVGHKYQVSAVAEARNDVIVSASVDSTVRIWRDGKCEQTLEHGSPVQCVLVLDNGDIISGCSDGAIRLWRAGKLAHSFQGHTDTVRGLAIMPDLGVISASHDQTLRLWDYAGTCMAEFVGHTAIVYAAAGSAQGLVASASEDNTARLWRPDGTCLQTIPHPACVWDVTFLANGDLATGCADYIARIFTSAVDRIAPDAVRAGFEAAVLAAAKQPESSDTQSAALPAGLRMEEASALAQPGRKAGEIKVIREGGAGIAYSWNDSAGTWEKIGAVVGGPGDEGSTVSVGSKMHNGQQYDFVFDVDVEDGAPPKKLPYNRGDNPYDAADRFMAAENLPWTYREQIVDFIVKNSGGGAALPAIPSVNVDPFTGGGSYTPSAGQQSRPAAGRPADSVTGGGWDPFTGSSTRRPSSSAAVPGPAAQAAPALIPQHHLTLFTSPLKQPAVAAKVREFNSQLAGSAESASLALAENEAAPGGLLESLLGRVCAPPAPAQVFPEAELAVLAKLLQWPAAKLFPALDITRLAVLHAAASSYLSATAGPLELSPLGSLGAAIAAAAEEPQLPANQQTALRLLANTCTSPQLCQWLLTHAQAVVDAWAPALTGEPSQPKAVRGAAVALLGNLAALTHPHFSPASAAGAAVAHGAALARDESASLHLGDDFRAQLLSALAEMLQNIPADDNDALFRALVAAGTVAQANDAALSLARDLDLGAVTARLTAGSSTPVTVRQAAAELQKLLSAESL